MTLKKELADEYLYWKNRFSKDREKFSLPEFPNIQYRPRLFATAAAIESAGGPELGKLFGIEIHWGDLDYLESERGELVQSDQGIDHAKVEPVLLVAKCMQSYFGDIEYLLMGREGELMTGTPSRETFARFDRQIYGRDLHLPGLYLNTFQGSGRWENAVHGKYKRNVVVPRNIQLPQMEDTNWQELARAVVSSRNT